MEQAKITQALRKLRLAKTLSEKAAKTYDEAIMLLEGVLPEPVTETSRALQQRSDNNVAAFKAFTAKKALRLNKN